MAGRPKANIDWNKVDKYLQADCTGTGIAGLLHIHPNTLYEECKRLHKCNFSKYSAEKKLEGDVLLKSVQFKEAMEGNISMLIWLGKQRLGQSDKNNVDLTVTEQPFFDMTKNIKEKDVPTNDSTS